MKLSLDAIEVSSFTTTLSKAQSVVGGITGGCETSDVTEPQICSVDGPTDEAAGCPITEAVHCSGTCTRGDWGCSNP